MNLHDPSSRYKGGPIAPRDDIPPADPPASDFGHAAALWYAAVCVRDFAKATRLRQEIRRRYRVTITTAPIPRGGA